MPTLICSYGSVVIVKMLGHPRCIPNVRASTLIQQTRYSDIFPAHLRSLHVNSLMVPQNTANIFLPYILQDFIQ
jgi:hypothetical protein